MVQRTDEGGAIPEPRPIRKTVRQFREITPVPQGQAPAPFRRAEKRARVARRSRRGSY